MKSVFRLILWSGLVSLLLISLFVPANRVHADSNSSVRRKISRDIIKKVETGHGADFVRVIVQPVTSSDLSIDSTIESAGGSNIRHFKNSAVRVVTLNANAAAALAA